MGFKILDFSVFMSGDKLLIAFITVLFYLLLYRAIFEKYKKRKLPPGPVGVPYFGYIPFLGKEPYETLRKLSIKYGGLIRFSCRKWSEMGRTAKVLHSCNAGCRSRKGIWGRPYDGTATSSSEEVNNLIRKIHSAKGKPVDVDNDLTASVATNILSLLIGRRLNEDVEKDKIQLCIDYSHIAMTYMGPLNPTGPIPGLRRFCKIFRIGRFHRASEIQENFFAFIRSEIQRHKTKSAHIDRNDFMSIYLEKIEELSSESKLHSFSESTLEGNVHVLFLGSSDTIISSLVWLIRLMAKHKQVQQRVYSELMEAFGKEGMATYAERHKIPYTFAVLMENLRYSKIGPISVTRKVTQDIPVENYIIPKGAEISANLWAMHHDPAYWKEPYVFKPERFLTEDGKSLIKQPPSYVPFSFGKRNCPGETIAWMEILSYFSEIIRNFEISTPPRVEPQFKVVPGLVCRLESQKLCFKPRI